MANDNLSVKVALLSSLLAATAAQAGIFAPAAGESGDGEEDPTR